MSCIVPNYIELLPTKGTTKNFLASAHNAIGQDIKASGIFEKGSDTNRYYTRSISIEGINNSRKWVRDYNDSIKEVYGVSTNVLSLLPAMHKRSSKYSTISIDTSVLKTYHERLVDLRDVTAMIAEDVARGVDPEFYKGNFQKESNYGGESLTGMTDKINRLKKNFGLSVTLDSDMKEMGAVLPYEPGESPTIKINPRLVNKDTVIHEFGHVYINLLGGTENTFIADGIKQLQGSKTWLRVAEAYPELNTSELGMEVLATAIGEEGADIFDDSVKRSRFMTWLSTFFDKLKALLGVPPNVAKQLAKEMISGKLRIGTPKGINYVQKQKMSSQEDVYNVLVSANSEFSNEGTTLIKDGVPYRNTSALVEEDFKRNNMEKKSYQRSVLEIFKLVNSGLDLTQVKEDFLAKQDKSKFGYMSFLDASDIEVIYDYCKKFTEKFKEEGKKVLIGNTVVDDREGVNIAGNIQITTVSQKGVVDIYNMLITLGFETTSEAITAEQSLLSEAAKSMGIKVGSMYTLPVQLVQGKLIPKPYVENNVNKEYVKKYLSTQLSVEALAKVSATAKKLVGVLQRKVSIIAKTIDSKTPIQQAVFDRFKQTVSDLADAEHTRVVTTFISTAAREVDALYKRLESTVVKDDYTLEDLRILKEYSEAYSSIEEVSELLRDPSIADEFRDEDYLKQVALVKGRIEDIAATYKKYSKLIIARNNKKEGKVFTARRNELEREFNKLEAKRYTGVKGVDIKEKKREYINRKIADEHSSLLKDEEARLLRQLSETDSDIGTVDLYVTDSRNLNDEIIQLAETKITTADFTVTSAVQDVYSDVADILEEVETLKGKSFDQEKMYSEMIERFDGKKTGYYVSEYFSEFDKQKKEVWEAYYSIEDKDTPEASDAYNKAIAWNKANTQSKYIDSFQSQLDNFVSGDDSNYKINRILAKYSDKANVSAKDLVIIKEILSNKSKKEKNPDAKKFFEQVEFIENESFIEAKERKEKQLGAGYNSWLSKQYYTVDGKERLLPMWSELSPLDKSVLNPEKGLPKTKWKNPQFEVINKLRSQGSPISKLYDKFIETNKESDNNVPLAQRLGYKLPAIEKSTVERVSEKGLFYAVKEGFNNAFRKTNTDIDLGEDIGASKKFGINSLRNIITDTLNVFTSEAGKEKKSIPIHYRKDLKNPEDQSYDLATLVLANYQTSKNYSEKTKVAVELEVIKDLVYERQVNQYTPDGKLKLDSFTGQAVKKSGDSNTYKALETLLDTRLYNIRMLGDASFNKKVGQLNNWASGTVMILNYLSAPANLIHGKVTSAIESTAGLYYSKSNLLKGEKEYLADVKGILSDIGSRRPLSKTNVLLNKFNVLDTYDALHNKFAENTKASRIARVNSLYGLQSGGEHMIQSTVMYAYLDTIKVKNTDGTEVSFTDAIDVVNGKIKQKEGFTITESQMADISASIARILSHQFGNYSTTNVAQIQRYAVGNMVVSLKKFFVGGAKRRYRGIGDWKNRIGEDNYNLQHYDPVLGHFVEGDYVTTFRVLRTMYQDFSTLKMQAIGQTWENMTDIEKSRFKRTMIELSVAMTALALSLLLKGDEDDDEKESTGQLMAMFLTRRLYSELSFWVNPIEVGRTLKTPAQSLSFTEKIFRMVIQLTDPTEEYTKGKRKGDSKLLKRISDITPIYAQWNRDLKTSTDFLYK